MVSHISLCTCKASEEFLVNRTNDCGAKSARRVPRHPSTNPSRAGNDHCHVAGSRKSSVDELVIIQQVAGAH